MWNVECGMWNMECGLWNVECGMTYVDDILDAPLRPKVTHDNLINLFI